MQTIFFGHTHFDHIGNLAPFPAGTAVVVGPGSVAVNELADELDVPDHVVKMRSVRTLMHRGDIWETVGCFKGVDYFGDGSLWILDTPGVRRAATYNSVPSLTLSLSIKRDTQLRLSALQRIHPHITS